MITQKGKDMKKMIKSVYDMFGMDEGFWTKDDMMEFAYELEDQLEKKFGKDAPKFHDGWIEDNVMHLTFEDSEGYTYDHEVKIDMRKIRKPRDLQKYLPSFVDAFDEQYIEYQSYL